MCLIITKHMNFLKEILLTPLDHDNFELQTINQDLSQIPLMLELLKLPCTELGSNF